MCTSIVVPIIPKKPASKPKTARQFVLAYIPQARYMNLCGAHCIDDHYNDRYLAYHSPSRSAAWREAKGFIERRLERLSKEATK